MTPRELLRGAASRLAGAGVPDPAVDAAALLSFVTGRPALSLRLDGENSLSPEALAAFAGLVARRLRREPLQYLTHEQSFMGRMFYVDGRVLIPRPETELLCERATAALRACGPGARALDLCCGSGCLGVSLALDAPAARVTATDVSRDALDVAEQNASALGARVIFLCGDLFAPVGADRFDLIVSNPPYIPEGGCASLQAEVRREPALALRGGADGLAFYRRIAREAPARLKPGGTLLLEAGDGEAEDVRRLLTTGGWTDVRVYPDYQNIPRMVEARR